jgi:hypothetical protein
MEMSDSLEDAFFSQYPIEERDSEGRLTRTSVVVDGHVFTTLYDAADGGAWSSETEENLIVRYTYDGEYSYDYLAEGPAVRRTTLYDDGGHAETVSSYQPRQGYEYPTLIESQYHLYDAQEHLLEQSETLVQDGVSTTELHRYDPQGHLLQQQRTVSRADYYSDEVHRYDPQGQLVEHTGILIEGNTTTSIQYDLASGLPSYEKVRSLDTVSEIYHDIGDAQPWQTITDTYYTVVSGSGYYTRTDLSRHVVLMDDGSTVTTERDTAGHADYAYTTVQTASGPLVTTATDYDLTNAFPWSSYTVHQAASAFGSYVTDTVTLRDDGFTVRAENLVDLPGGKPFQYGTHTVFTDAQGHLATVVDTYTAPGTATGGAAIPFLRAQLDYSATTGLLDNVNVLYADGRQDSVDYNPATGLADYGVARFTDGHVFARDYDAAGRLDYAVTTYANGSLLAQDYDTGTGNLISSVSLLTDRPGHTINEIYDPATGRLDYRTDSNANGRLVQTDYDLANTQDWSSFSLSYQLTGDPRRPYEAIPNVEIVYDDGHRYLSVQDYTQGPIVLPAGSRTAIYDAQGRMDYSTERGTDGHLTATDYDLTDQQPWTTFSITYDALGNVQSTHYT